MAVVSVLLDVTSIQRFVFASNKLKENEGASYLVETFYDEAVTKSIPKNWQENTDYKKGYTGGGNALYFFPDEPKSEQFIKALTLLVIKDFPGIKLAAASIPDNAIAFGQVESLAGKPFQNMMENLHKELKKNRNRAFPVTDPLGQAVTAYDVRNGKPAEKVPKVSPISQVSRETDLKLEHVKDSRKSRFRNILDEINPDLNFPESFGEFRGESEGNSHIAVVHIDGNSMGKRFQDVSSLEMMHKMAKSVETATGNAFKSVLKWLIKDEIQEAVKSILKNKDFDDKMVPIIPIIMGGDDITFVTDAQMGLVLTEKFIKAFAVEKVEDKKDLSSCAGIAITGTKYPFYRGVHLAETLAKNAKKQAHLDKYQDTSWLDFHIAYGGMSGELETIRQDHFKVQQAKAGKDKKKDKKLEIIRQDHFKVQQEYLINGPYMVHTHDKNVSADDNKYFSTLLNGIRHFQKKDSQNNYIWPRSKIKELRSALCGSKAQLHNFQKDMKYRKREFPPSIKNDPIPCFDMIEMMEFYPEALSALTT